MKVLLAGEHRWDFYEPQFARALRAEGAEVVPYPYLWAFGPFDLARRMQMRLMIGWGPVLANAGLLIAVRRTRPDVVLAWRCPWIWRWTVRLARRLGAKAVVAYNNDDPFGPDRDRPIWRSFRRSLRAIDAYFAYRPVNLAEALVAGAQQVRLLLPGFDPELHRPRDLHPDEQQRFQTDVVFIGHYENDGRDEVIRALLDASLRVRVHGSGWEESAVADLLGEAPTPVLGEDYVAALRASSVALVLLSRRNRDGYTRRCFEIPATATAMLAPDTPELRDFFRSGDEVLYYRTPTEAVQQARALVADAQLRDRIGRAGHRRAVTDGYDVRARARGFLEDVRQIIDAGRTAGCDDGAASTPRTPGGGSTPAVRAPKAGG